MCSKHMGWALTVGPLPPFDPSWYILRAKHMTLRNVVCLVRLDTKMKDHLYAEDTQLYAECPPSNNTDVLRRLRNCVDDLKRWLDRNHLLLNESKTEAIVFRSAAVHVTSVESTVDVCGAIVPLLPTIRDIGVILDNGLDMSAQVSNACRGAYFHLFRIAKIRKCLNTAACKTLVHSLVTSRIDYGNAVLYGISDRLLHTSPR